MEFTMRLRRNTLKHQLTTKRKAIYGGKLRLSYTKPRCLCKDFEIDNSEFPQIWKDFLMQNQLIDGVVRCCDGKEFKIHRIILSAASPYFRALFTNSINRCNVERYETEVVIPSGMFKLLLEYAYTGSCQINKNNVKKLLIYADYYDILGVVRKCCDFLYNDINVKNCLEILGFANQYSCYDLVEKCHKYVLKHFMKILNQNRHFLYLHIDELITFLNDDELNIKKEHEILDIIVKWVKYRRKTREIYILKLLKCIRLGRLDENDLVNISQHPMIKRRQECCEYLKTTNNLIQKFYNGEVHHSLIRNMFRNRISQDVLFAIGGWDVGRPTNTIETYNICADNWLISSHSEYVPRAYHGICTINRFIYIIGGFDGTQYFNTVRKYDPINYKWSDCASMYDHRCYVSVVACDKKIYAMGGYNGRVRLKSLERYDPERNQWEVMPSMCKQRSDAGAAVLDSKIYIVGGFNGHEVMRSAEVFDINENQWSFIPQMISPRSGVSLVAYQEALYVFGGFDGETRLNNGEKYVPASHSQWSEISDMLTNRSNFATAILDDFIFVIGGFNGQSTISSVEYYDPGNDKWYEAASMNLRRSALSAVVVDGLPNIREYSYKTSHIGFM